MAGEPDRLEVIPWPHGYPNPRNSWWVARWSEGRGYLPLAGPFDTRKQADARLEDVKREEGVGT